MLWLVTSVRQESYCASLVVTRSASARREHGLFERHVGLNPSSTASGAGFSGESARLRSRSSRARSSRITSSGCTAGTWAELIEAAQAADFRRRIEEDLDVGVGKDHGADVAAFHHHAACRAQLLLQADHPGANGGKNADARSGVGHGLIANQAGDVFAVEQNTVLLFAGLEANGGFGGKLFKAAALRREESPREEPSGRRRDT